MGAQAAQAAAAEIAQQPGGDVQVEVAIPVDVDGLRRDLAADQVAAPIRSVDREGAEAVIAQQQRVGARRHQQQVGVAIAVEVERQDVIHRQRQRRQTLGGDVRERSSSLVLQQPGGDVRPLREGQVHVAVAVEVDLGEASAADARQRRHARCCLVDVSTLTVHPDQRSARAADDQVRGTVAIEVAGEDAGGSIPQVGQAVRQHLGEHAASRVQEQLRRPSWHEGDEVEIAVLVDVDHG